MIKVSKSPSYALSAQARRPSPRTIPPGNLAIGLWNPSNNKRWQVIQGENSKARYLESLMET
jgi:hypothetical protein